jgi:chitin synthase
VLWEIDHKGKTRINIVVVFNVIILTFFFCRSKFLFMACLIGFSFIMCYMLFCSSWLIYKGIQLAAEKYSWSFDTTTNFQIAMNDPGLRNMVLSLGSTFGIYFVASCLHKQPYHMITSFIPYLLLLPGFINILNIYAFCNTHDVR